MALKITRNELVARLVRAGELQVSGDNATEIINYFDTVNFKFHGPSGFDSDYAGLMSYFSSVRAAFENRSIKRGIIIVEGNYVSCQTYIEGKFVNEFTQSPAGLLPPNGKRIIFDLINIFQFDDEGKIIEEWVQTDNAGLISQLEKTS